MTFVDTLETLDLLGEDTVVAFDHGIAVRRSDGLWDVLWNDDPQVVSATSEGLWGVCVWAVVRWSPEHTLMTNDEVLRALVWADFIGKLLDQVSIKRVQQQLTLGPSAPVYLDADIDILESLKDCYKKRGIPLD